MPIVCPHCATSYGVEMASPRPASGRMRQLRCQHCRWVWQVDLSAADKLLVAADAMPAVRRTMLAAAQAAAEPIREPIHEPIHEPMRSRLPLRRATTLLAEELEARFPAKHGSMPYAALRTETSDAKPVAMAWTQLVEAIEALIGSGLARRRRLPLSRLQCVILALALADAVIIGLRADLVWAMPQTASFYAGLGLPVNLRGIHFDRLAATAEQHDGERVLVVKGEIGNGTRKTEDVPYLRFAIRNAEHQEIYSWTAPPARGRLSARETLAFHSELALPPPDARDVVVQFVDRENTF